MPLQMKRLEDQNLALALQLESCTGRPASDWGSIPATPSDLILPNQAGLSPVSQTLLQDQTGVCVCLNHIAGRQNWYVSMDSRSGVCVCV